ncbi:bifunctional metallophosphatase/5'-nucleotidase [Francisella adeliensis]|uniref:Bifunctional metallophosphatase/5'-nucleotidase n=1 Tax=Francisella adeliensis TaxID=2007306 RepID=A0A2Z4XZ89_9GAMM|nr:5'-nucleotidase C-terminal domain-containing protein [Francisella adeliensis]AXA34090.1 bifunctional metallophosphatase/5'-nucleotidase [Francisella adeliensis]MBK2085257.1 5'-nucleotidase C-terminal domain-containing protein [Francisella adeliensis]MBK2095975.1 5'-nucleotidase C-terminal domain-containing protein [Francisella adeliensis]QIW12331.1 bifunctional metallophosphatase/5'-nucleotidase [Francisella adeliensis]QIW14205.1 bifunctional metallophosphatase/5'-nucleotidase [Francisella 
MKKYFIAFVLCTTSLLGFAEDDITVLSLNDFHGQVEPHKDMVGAAKIATFVKDYRKTHPNLVVVAAGDNYQGTAISNISHGDVVNDFFDYIGVKYSAVGNHDFDYGQKWFKHWYKASDVRFLAANISYVNDSLTGYVKRLFSGDNSLDYIKPFGYETFENGKTIYFVGLSTLETPKTTAEKHISNLHFTNPVYAANKWIRYIHNYREHNLPKPDTIVLLTHIPTEQVDNNILYKKNSALGNQSEIYAVVNGVKGITAVLTGHSHEFVNGFKNNIAVEQGESQGKDISVLHYDCHTTDVCKVTPEVINLAKVTKDLADDKEVNAIIEKYNSSVKDELEKVITTAPKPLSDKTQDGHYNVPLTYTLANIMKVDTHSDVALLNTHGVRRSLPSGNISYSMIYEVMPFDNMVVTMDIKGSNLLDLVKHSLQFIGDEQSGIFAGVKIALNKDSSIKSTTINNKPLDKNKYYKLATIDFLVSGGDGFIFKGFKNYKDTSIPVREVIVSYWQGKTAHIAKGWQNVAFEG